MRDEGQRPSLSRGLTPAGGLESTSIATLSSPLSTESKAAMAASASIGLAMKSKAMQLKLKGSSREVSERRQVGDAEALVNDPQEGKRWWRDVGMDEGL